MKLFSKFLIMVTLLTVSFGWCLPTNKVYAAENELKNETKAITTSYGSYCYSKAGSLLYNYTLSSESSAFSAIWNEPGSWKGFVLRDYRNGINTSNLKGVVLSNEAGYYPININFDTSYYQLSYYSSKNNREFVKGVQQALKWLGYNIGSTGIDGDFGYNTESAVLQFQKNHNLPADGIVGKETYLELARASY